jgi:two-component system NtrC family sensor kinase
MQKHVVQCLFVVLINACFQCELLQLLENAMLCLMARLVRMENEDILFSSSDLGQGEVSTMDNAVRILPIDEKSELSEPFLDQLAFNEKMAELGQLACGMIHELNTPLSVIAAATQLILREEGLSEHVMELLERIDGETQRLSHMSRGILSFSRLDGGGRVAADINLVVTDVLQMLAYEIQKRSVTVHESLDHRLPLMVIDAGRLKQVLINLIMNALHAMTSGGILSIHSLASESGECEIRINDTGHGIPDETLARIFEPFFTTKVAGEGTGLGLYVTGKIIAALGGSIDVVSRSGQGSCFTIRLPLTEA